jgi:hypothetical protein
MVQFIDVDHNDECETLVRTIDTVRNELVRVYIYRLENRYFWRLYHDYRTNKSPIFVAWGDGTICCYFLTEKYGT